jgi:type IV pilus assembly protein PilO
MELSMPKTQREQLMVFLGAIGLLAAGFYWYTVYRPAAAKLVIESTRIDSLDDKNKLAKALMASGTARELREQSKVYMQNLDVMRQLVPASNEVPTLLDQISTSARRADLEVSKLQPMGTELGTDFDAYRYELTITGGYHDIAEFLTNVGSMPRIVVPLNLRMTAIGTQGGPRRTVSTTVELHTYVAHTTAAPAKGGE